jgi:hypothetical protein
MGGSNGNSLRPAKTGHIVPAKAGRKENSNKMTLCKPWNMRFSFKTIVEGSLEVKLPTIWTDEKQRWKGSERRGE